jgi:glucuronate isomerase
MTNLKLPSSQMIRVPTALIPAVRELSKLHRQGHTIALQQALADLIILFDSSDDIDLAPGNKSIEKLEKQLNTIELKLTEKLDTINSQLEQISRNGGVAKNRGNYTRSRSYASYQQHQVESRVRVAMEQECTLSLLMFAVIEFEPPP